jgi:hypothetical protein
MLHQSGKCPLEHIGYLIFVQAGTAGNGLNETLVAIDKQFPGTGIPLAAGQDQGLIAGLVLMRIRRSVICLGRQSVFSLQCLQLHTLHGSTGTAWIHPAAASFGRWSDTSG